MAEEWYQRDPFPNEPNFATHSRTASEASSRRRSHYGSQRMSHPSQSISSGSQRQRNAGATYDEPAGVENLDEVAIPPPIQNPDERSEYRRHSGLEDNIEEGQPTTKDEPKHGFASLKKSFSRKRGGARDPAKGLTEVAAPPPVQQQTDEEAGQGVGRADFLEEKEGEESSDQHSPPAGHDEEEGEEEEEEEEEDASDEVPPLLTNLYTVSYLIFFSIWGTLARLGVQWLTFYPGAPVVTPVIWANFGGSLVLGFLAEDQCLFRDDTKLDSNRRRDKQRRRSKIANDLDDMAKGAATKRKKAIPLYIGLAIGFCGSFTSFSSFARDIFLAVANDLPTSVSHPHTGFIVDPSATVSRPAGYSFEAFLQLVITTIALSVGGLISGAQIAVFMDPFTPRIHGKFVEKYVDNLAILLGFGCWLGAVFLAIWPPDRGTSSTEAWRGQVIFAIVFAPLGCLLRFYASMKLNGLVPAFPLGTFAVNMFGTAVEAMCFDLQHAGVGAMGKVGGGLVGCQVLQGVMDGFCGCLTTVSTWAAEINGLKRRHGWLYAMGSVIGGLCLVIVIMGGVRWSVGYQNPVCNTGYTSKVHG